MWCTRYAVTIRAKNFSTPVAFAIGVVQGLAVLPGISRSGSTIAAALFMGIDRNTAAKYSFLMSIPAIAGAALLQLKDTHEIGISFTVLAAGMLTSCITGYLALSFLVFIVNKGKLYIFAPYCWFVGVAAIVYGYVHHF
jgi:undecaprenyl-diphosphatase